MKDLFVKSALALLICALMMTVVGCNIFDDTKPEPDDEIPHTHSYTEEVTKAPSCSAEGEKTFTCSCGDSYTEAVAKLPHTEVVDSAVAPTCTEAGKSEGSHCSVCNEVIVKQTVVESPGHKNDVVITTPTCTEPGHVTYTCTVCGKVSTGNSEPALGHTEVVDKGTAATCTTAGKTDGKHCSVCNEILVEQTVIEALGHTEAIDPAKAPTCTETGKTEGSHCSVCNEILVAQQPVAPAGHKYDSVVIAPTCTAEGYTTHTCSACGDTYADNKVSASGHSEKTIAAVAPTCTETGLTEGKKCTVCGEITVAQQTVAAKGHSASDAVKENVNDSTCSALGSYESVVYCSVCSTELSRETKTIEMKPHTEVVDAAVAPDCTETGLTEGKHCSVCGVTTVAQQTVPAKGHTEKVIEGTPVTCKSSGLTAGKQCTVCGEITLPQEEIKSNGHLDVRTTAATAASCTKEGKTEGKYCAECGDILVVQTIIPMLAHTYDNDSDLTCNVCGQDRACMHAEKEIVPGYDATCTKSGLEDGYKCKICGDIVVAQKVIPATGHSEIKIPAVAPTCTEPGATEGLKCFTCGEILTNPTPIIAKGHTEKTIAAVAATCTQTGLTEGKICSVCNTVTVKQEITPVIDHSYSTEWSKDGAEHWHACSVCGDKADKSEHAYSKEIARVNATCEKDGYYTLACVCGATKDVKIPAPGHSYSDKWTETESQHWHECSSCGSKKDVANHDYTKEIARTEATCTEAGSYTMQCVCGDTKTETIKAKGHSYTSSVTAPTCIDNGYTTHTCSVCNYSYKDSQVTALGHTEVVDPAVKPNCTETGLTEGKHCSVCNTVIVAQTKVDALGHTPVVDKAKDPTCTEIGLTEGSHCSACDEVLVAQKEIAANGHTEVTDSAKAPTCTESGLTEGKHCSVCGETLVEQETVAALGHTPETDAAKDPTCTESGLTEGSHCSACGETLVAQEKVDALGHTPETDAAKAPTCTETGLTEGSHCSVCGETLVAQETVAALGHAFDGDSDAECNNECGYKRTVVLKSEFVNNVDVSELENKGSLVLNLSENINNAADSALTFTVKLGEDVLALDGAAYTYTLGGSYTEKYTYVSFDVTVSFVADGEEKTLNYTYKLGLVDSTGCKLENGGFESGMDGWTQVGNIGGISSDRTYWVEEIEFGMDGDKMFSAYAPDATEAAVGTLTSSSFKVGGSGFVTFKIGAMRDANYVYVDVVEAGTDKILARYYNGLWTDADLRGCQLVAYKADLSAFMGKEVYFRISDNADSGYGLFFADSFVTFYKDEPDGFNTATHVDYQLPNTIYDLFNGGFEMGDVQGWWNVGNPGAVTGADAFFSGVAYGKDGNFLYSGVEDHLAGNGREGNKGTLTSSAFKLGGTGYITYMLGGGGNERCYIQILDAITGEVLATYRQQAMEDAVLKLYAADLSAFIGRTLRIQVVDDASSDWGCVSFDNVVTYYASMEDLPAGAIAADDLMINDRSAINAEFALEITDQGDYTLDSYNAYLAKLADAKAVAEKALVLQADLDKAAAALTEARLALEVRPVSEKENTNKSFNLVSGNIKEINIADYVDTNGLGKISYAVKSDSKLAIVSEIANGVFTITADKVNNTTYAKITVTVYYDGTEKLNVELDVKITNDIAPVVFSGSVEEKVDLINLENKAELVIDLSKNVDNAGNLPLTYSVNGVALESALYTITLGSYTDKVVSETLTVTVSYVQNGEAKDLSYTYSIAINDTTDYRIENGGFENGLEGWTQVGNIGGITSDRTYWNEGIEFGMDGNKMFSAYAPGVPESAIGTLTSPSFKVGGSGFVTFKVGAMKNERYVYVDVVEVGTGKILARYYNGLWTDADLRGCQLVAYKADLSAFMGKEVYFRISDMAETDYGLFFVDSFVTYYESEPDGFNPATPVSYAVSGTVYDVINGGFENGDLYGWWSIGEIGVVTNANGFWGDNIPYGKDGDFLFTGVESFGADTMREGNKGTLTSFIFEIGGTGYISFKLGGGENEHCYVQIIDAVTGEVLARYHQQAIDRGILKQYVADLSAYIGRSVRIQVVDYASSGWGCVSFDSVVTYYASTDDLPKDSIAANNIFHGNYSVTNGSFENGLDGWRMEIYEAGAHNTLGWVESSEHDAGWYTKNDGRKDGNNIFTFCRPDGTNCENTRGALISNTFTLKQNTYVSFRFGGAGTRAVRVELVRADGQVIATFYNEAPGKINTEMHAYFYQYTGETVDCFFRVVDDSVSNYGCFVVDDFRANLESAPEGFIEAIR